MNFDNLMDGAVNPKYISISYEELAKKDLQIKPEAFINEVIYWCREFSFTDLTNLKLQKLLYYAYAMVLKKVEKMPFCPLLQKQYFDDHYVERMIDFWQIGPVMPKAYQELKHFGDEIMARFSNDYSKVFLKTEQYDYKGDVSYIIEKIKEIKSTKLVIDAIKYILIAIGDFSANRLVDLTHSEQSAWYVFHRQGKKNQEKAFLLEKILNEIAFYNFFESSYLNRKHLYDESK